MESAKAEGFKINCEKNSAQKVANESANYVKMMIKIKNTGEKNQEIFAKKFFLVFGEKRICGAFFGNNAIDKMESERLDSSSSADLVLTFETEMEEDFADVYYGKTRLWQIRF